MPLGIVLSTVRNKVSTMKSQGLLGGVVRGSAALLFGLLVQGVGAQTWKQVVSPMDSAASKLLGETTLYLDQASPVATSSGQEVMFRYRTTSPSSMEGSKSVTLENEVAVNCARLSMRDLKVQSIHQGYTTPVDLSGSMTRAFAVDPFSIFGRAAIMACEQALPGSLQRFRSVPSAEACEQSSNVKDFALCKADVVRVSIGVVRERTLEVARVCGNPPFFSEALERAIQRAKTCIAGEQCVLRAVGWLELALRTDASLLANGEQPQAAGDCESARSIRRYLAQEHRKEQAAQDLKDAERNLAACATKAIRRLDDRASGANVIARAAIASCKTESNRLMAAAATAEPPTDDRQIRSRLEEDLAVNVLENRARRGGR